MTRETIIVKVVELIVAIMWVVGTFLLFLALLNASSENMHLPLSIVFTLTQIFIVLITLPFLVFTMYRSGQISIWFTITLTVLSLLNTTFMAIAGQFLSEVQIQYLMIAGLEFLPIVMLFQNRDKITTVPDHPQR